MSYSMKSDGFMAHKCSQRKATSTASVRRATAAVAQTRPQTPPPSPRIPPSWFQFAPEIGHVVWCVFRCPARGSQGLSAPPPPALSTRRCEILGRAVDRKICTKTLNSSTARRCVREGERCKQPRERHLCLVYAPPPNPPDDVRCLSTLLEWTVEFCMGRKPTHYWDHEVYVSPGNPLWLRF